ncbi:ECF transporter S component [Pseudalkalibacillus caeni]|uniref:ECF transporter S component n=1 Tax=Exobacillus caeni TaxID=2574798 RepID=A0A5R9F610_9BACL|nr:ECF transporter S component [Pseudalkalibacillus caeni]TLS35914.1 ECF transporter S component [Pseudalkalibacillus caeni]
MARSSIYSGLIVTGMLGLLIFSIIYFPEHYLMISFLFIGLTLIPFLLRFEMRKITGKELVLLAMLSAVAAVSRVPFAAFPSIQPTTFVIIVSALVLGAESGFMIGAMAALVSNLFLGQGPWTPWQMYSWGLIGFLAGILRNTWFMKHLWGKALFGLITGFAFGWIMNLWFIIGFLGEITFSSVFAYYATSFYFDLAHAVSNVFFILVFSSGWIKILQRFKRKYGLLAT